MSEPLHPEVVILNAALELPAANRAGCLDPARARKQKPAGFDQDRSR